MLEQFDTWIQQLGSLGYLLLALGALLEYLVPPFPGDTVLLLGGAVAGRGEKSLPLVFLSVMAGSLLGVSAVYWAGRGLGRSLDRRGEGKILFFVTHAQLRRVQTQMRERGGWLLVANRFLPTVRTAIFLAAGASRMPFGRVLALGAISAAAWNVALLAVGFAVGGNVERLMTLHGHYVRVSYVLLGLVVVALGVRAALRRRRQRA